MLILGVETSCDDTAMALIDHTGHCHAHHISSSLQNHAKWGGIVPQIAANDHASFLPRLLEKTVQSAKISASNIDLFSATCGPGLIGSLLTGVVFTKTMAVFLDKPFLPIHHLEAHALMVRYKNTVHFPYLLLLVSGGHTQFVLIHRVGQYTILGQTLDDALGEAFDKVARLLGLGYPGGAALEKLAAGGNPDHTYFPRPLMGRSGCNFSFSGLKTSARRHIEKYLLEKELCAETKNHLAASFQKAVIDVLEDRTCNAIKIAKEQCPTLKHFCISGGVAANKTIRRALQTLTQKQGLSFCAPEQKFCTDNGLMVAWAALERFNAGSSHNLDLKTRARWPMDEVTC